MTSSLRIVSPGTCLPSRSTIGPAGPRRRARPSLADVVDASCRASCVAPAASSWIVTTGWPFSYPGVSVDELVAGHDDVAVQQDRRAVLAHRVELGAERRSAAPLGFDAIVLLVDEVELERRRRAEDALGLAGSWIPGSSTRMRSRPWRCTTASATPSSLTRLRSVTRVLLNREILALADRRSRQA